MTMDQIDSNMEVVDRGDAATERAATDAAGSAVDRNHFPTRLHKMLESCHDSISWQPHGKVFLIRDKGAFVEQVLPKWFCRLKMTSFQRQLCLYGFRKLTRKGPDQGGYYHPRFLRDRLDLAVTIEPTKVKGKRGRRPKNDDNEPNFYDLSSNRTPELPAIGLAKLKKNPKTPSPPKEKTSGNTSLALSRMLRNDPDIDAGSVGLDDLLRLPKEESPDQQTLEALFQSMSKDSTQHSMTPGEYSTGADGDLGWADIPPPNQSLHLDHECSLEQHLHHREDLVNSSRAVVRPSGVIRRPSLFSSTASGWATDSLAAEDFPGAASFRFPRTEDPGMSFSQVAGPSDTFTPNVQLPPVPDDQFQRLLQEQRLKDYMDLNQKQQNNLRIQQQQLEQQRLELQLRQQEQLQHLRMELHARGGQQIPGQNESRHFPEPMPQAPPLFQPHFQERLRMPRVSSLGQQNQPGPQQGKGKPEHDSSQLQQQQQYRPDNWLP